MSRCPEFSIVLGRVGRRPRWEGREFLVKWQYDGTIGLDMKREQQRTFNEDGHAPPGERPFELPLVLKRPVGLDEEVKAGGAEAEGAWSTVASARWR